MADEFDVFTVKSFFQQILF